MDPCELVRQSCAKASRAAGRRVWVDEDRLADFAKELSATLYDSLKPAGDGLRSVTVEWNADQVHYDSTEHPERLLTYLFILDSLNFCFWPCAGLEYHHLSLGLRRALEAHPERFTPEFLATQTTAHTIREWFTSAAEGSVAARVDEQSMNLELRAAFIRQNFEIVLCEFRGSMMDLLSQCENSAVRLVHLVATRFPAFQDHTVLCTAGSENGNAFPVYFYKRAQIFVADVWGALRGTGIASFADIHNLTMFADYRVPQVLHDAGVLRYAEDLETRIMQHTELDPGSCDETAIRAATVHCVELIKEKLRTCVHEDVPRDGHHHRDDVCAVQIDWALWQRGERMVLSGHTIHPHHRTRTIWY
eukprot:ANDGO_03012.mRNA.1 UPF0553 protein